MKLIIKAIQGPVKPNAIQVQSKTAYFRSRPENGLISQIIVLQS